LGQRRRSRPESRRGGASKIISSAFGKAERATPARLRSDRRNRRQRVLSRGDAEAQRTLCL
jgi:hypothetical protein